MALLKHRWLAILATVGALFLSALGLQSSQGSSRLTLAAQPCSPAPLPSLDAFLDAAAQDMYGDGHAGSSLRRRPLAGLPKLPFIHVPKTAGTWFREALDSAVIKIAPDQLAEYYIQSVAPRLDARWLYGHLVNLTTFAEFDTVHVIWVRRPVQRLISTYFYHLLEYRLFKSSNQTLPRHLRYVQPGMPVDQWIANSFGHVQWMKDNIGPAVKPPLSQSTDRVLQNALLQSHMAPFRSLFPTGSIMDLINERDRLRVLYQLRSFPLIVERFSDSLKAFSRALFDDQGAYEKELLERMKTPKNGASKRDRASNLTWADVIKFEEASWNDLVHYEVAVETFERNLRHIQK